MKKLTRKQKRNILLVFAFLAFGSAVLAIGVKNSDDIQAKWDEIQEKFESDDVEDDKETEKTPATDEE